MSAQDIPEWFKEEMSVFLLQKGYSENDWSYDEITDGMVHAFKLLSIPTNAAKIPEVARLIEACKPEGREVPNTILGEGFTVFNLNREKIREALTVFSLNKEKIDKALSPFKGGE